MTYGIVGARDDKDFEGTKTEKDAGKRPEDRSGNPLPAYHGQFFALERSFFRMTMTPLLRLSPLRGSTNR